MEPVIVLPVAPNSKHPKKAFFSRYNGRGSALSLAKLSSSCGALVHLSYHSSKASTLKPISEAKSEPTSSRSVSGDEPIADVGLPQFLTTIPLTKNKYHKDLNLEKLPQLPKPFTPKSIPLLESKISLCLQQCDFSDQDADKEAKAIKTDTLNELLSFMDNISAARALPSEVLDQLFNMLIENLRRPIPQIPKRYFFVDEPLVYDIAWPHLSIIYQLLSRYQFLFPEDTRFDQKFQEFLVDLLRAPDPNERDNVSNLIKTYLKTFPDRELSVLQQLNNTLSLCNTNVIDSFPIIPIVNIFLNRYLIQTNHEFKIKMYKTNIIELLTSAQLISLAPCLRDLFDIVLGNSMRLQNEQMKKYKSSQHFFNLEEEDDIFQFPGHTNNRISLQEQVQNPNLENSENDELHLARQFIYFIIEHWPFSRPSKQILFLQFLEKATEKLTNYDFAAVSTDLFSLYARIADPEGNAKVIQESFKIYQNVVIIPKIVDNTSIIYPIIYPAIDTIMHNHWSSITQNKAISTLNSLQELDPSQFADETKKKKEVEKNPPVNKYNDKLKNWVLIARVASKYDKTINLNSMLATIQKKFNPPDKFKKVAKPKKK